MKKNFKRYCKTLELKNDPKLIEEYRKMHAPGAGWPEILRGMREVGIIDMEIYLSGCMLFMIMDTVPDFDHDSAMSRLAALPRQAEWEAAMSRFQRTTAGASADEKWKLMDRIFKMDGEAQGGVRDGYLEIIRE
jgi:L-rhamnose mutarotase